MESDDSTPAFGKSGATIKSKNIHSHGNIDLIPSNIELSVAEINLREDYRQSAGNVFLSLTSATQSRNEGG